MPSIEIISLNSDNLKINQTDYDFAIIVENGKIQSHRNLFNNFLKQLNGTIIHIGNPEFKNEDFGFFAGKIIDWDSKCKNDFKFLPQFEIGIKKLLHEAQNKSPEKSIIFLTDYQFSKRKPKVIEKLNLEKFLKIYDSKGLEFNRLYKIIN